MADLARIYLDSCCFIDIAKQSIGNLVRAREADVWHTWKILEAHKAGEVLAYTSVVTITECTHADSIMDAKVRDVFTRLLSSGQYVALVQPTPFIAMDGRDLAWKHKIALRGVDFLHVASGLAVKCTEFLTTDTKIQSQSAKIEKLGMRVCTSSQTVLLPDKYRQWDMLDDKVTPITRKSEKR